MRAWAAIEAASHSCLKTPYAIAESRAQKPTKMRASVLIGVASRGLLRHLLFMAKSRAQSP